MHIAKEMMLQHKAVFIWVSWGSLYSRFIAAFGCNAVVLLLHVRL